MPDMPTSSLPSDTLPACAREVIALYADAMPDVRFPDLDLDVLEGAAAELRASLDRVKRATAELEAARAAAQAQAELLESRAERALAYARVFAHGDPALSDRIATISHHKAPAHPEAAAPKKRGRPKKTDGDTTLFDTAPASAVRPVESIEDAA
jgi:hypothetical protein